jgi:hypothetical protein
MIGVASAPVAREEDAVVEERQRGVNAVAVQPRGLGPPPAGIRRGNDEVATLHVRRDEKERAVVVAERRRENAAGAGRTGQVELALARERVADRSPIDEVAAMEDRHAGEVLEAAARKVEVAADPTDRGVGVHARQDGVRELHPKRLSL